MGNPFEAPELAEGADPTINPEGAEGGNRYAYWVANSVHGEFTKLPPVTPEQIIAARRLRRMFTGNLDTVVGGHPPFPGGTEKEFLRAVIGLITMETHVVPKDILKADEEDPWTVEPNEEEPDEFTPPTAAELSKSVASWQLLNPQFNADGRCRNAETEENDDEEDEEAKSDATPEFPPLGALSASEWGVGMAGQRGCVRSSKWHGAVGLAAGTYYINVYIGYGIPTTGTSNQSYCPPFPWAIADEQTDAGIVEAPDVLEAPLPPPGEEGEEEEEEEDY